MFNVKRILTAGLIFLGSIAATSATSEYTITATNVGSAYIRISYGSFKDSVLITVNPATAPILAVTNVATNLSKLSHTKLGVDLSWNTVLNAVSYDFRLFYQDTTGVPFATSLNNTAYAVLDRNVGQTYTACVKATNTQGIKGPETCLNTIVADLDSISLWQQKDTLQIGTQMTICGYAWYLNKVIPDVPMTFSSSDTTVAKILTQVDDGTCLNRIPLAQIWPSPVITTVAPVANFTNLCTRISGQRAFNCTFTDGSSSSGSSILVGWSWDFGDNSVSSLKNPTHVYNNFPTGVNTRVYTIALTVTDTNGLTATTTKTITLVL